MTDTAHSSWITDHAFESRTKAVDIPVDAGKPFVWLPPNPALCQHCRLAEAAHRETTR